MTTDRIILLQPPPFHFRSFCRCAISPSGTDCMRRPRPRASRRQRGGHGGRAGGGRDRGGGDSDGGDGPPPRSRALRAFKNAVGRQ